MTGRVTIRAVAWRSGLIEFVGGRCPGGAIELAGFRDRRAALVATRVVSAKARHAYSGELLVPGVPEADNDDIAVDALIAWRQQLRPALLRHIPARRLARA